MFTFTPEQIEQYRAQGWVAVPEFWSAHEIAGMRAELDRLRAIGLLRNVAMAGDGKTEAVGQVNLQLCPMSPHSRFFRAMPFAPQAMEAAAQLVGDPVLLQLDQVFLKPGRQGSGTNWHQDNAYFRIQEPMGGTALWTAVHDATRENGTMRVIPGSFREVYEHSRDLQSNHHIRCYPDESRAVTVELPAGGALFFAYGTAHATGGNNTDKDRAGVALHFLNAEAAKTAPGNFSERFPILTGPQASGGEREYGERVAGTWQDEIEAALAREPVAA